ncbi:Alpha/Beta hydrolase protein [Vararia minispora EC-137]|uniref:Alpha/Beta hydrolase protein n=1 Tax=Vararia minispora EC-137 TaxID=1314806 RepID=A0ACB8QTZ4_9AGAM|nr:Alpha/Beta hydrolase protein [Vararia minispora EC-137]
MTTSRKTTKLVIPHSSAEGINLVGLLEQLDPEAPTEGQRVALILHGTMGHKDYLFQKRLAQRLPIDSFRFDFRGAFESGGQWKYAAFWADVEDLRVVVRHLTSTYGYVVDLLVGHSRGSVVAMLWICNSEEGKNIGGFVNVSGRYRMDVTTDHLPRYMPSFDEKGFYDWHVTVARQPVVGRFTLRDMEEFAALDTSLVWDKFPARTDVLSIHGLADKVVPVYDATIYARAYGTRNPGTHNLHLVENGDHNLSGHFDEVVSIILDWWAKHGNRELKTGVWGTGSRHRL